MIFFSVLKTLIGERITVEMKNDVLITGTLDHVDQYLNIKLSSIEVQEEEKHPHLLSVAAVFIRGSVVRYLNDYYYYYYFFFFKKGLYSIIVLTQQNQ